MNIKLKAYTSVLAVSATLTVFMPGASAAIVGESKLASFCAEQAATKLGVARGKVLTLPVERTAGKYHVYGQYPESGPEPTLFECQFDGKRSYLGMKMDGHHGHATHTAGSAPRPAQRGCLDMIGVPANVEKVSPLRPGYFEIIMKETNSSRRVACTVKANGTIEDWVEMQ